MTPPRPVPSTEAVTPNSETAAAIRQYLLHAIAARIAAEYLKRCQEKAASDIILSGGLRP